MMQQQQQSNVTVPYDHLSHGVPDGNRDAGDAVNARWIQSAGLQHSASSSASTGDDSLIPNLLMQGYAGRSAEEKQRISRLMRILNFNCPPDSDHYPLISQASSGVAATDGYLSPEFRADFGSGLLDLHSMDDTELLTEHVISEPFESPSFMPAVTKACDGEFDVSESWQQRKEGDHSDFPSSLLPNERDYTSRENNVAKIRVVVRKRPLNRKETARKEEDIVTVHKDTYLTVHEPKLKVDLTAYIEKHEFCFDAVLDEHVTNDEVYRVTVEPIIPTIFQHTKATCFAYGQTGSGKTYTMKPLPLRASEDLLRLLHHPMYQNQRYKLCLSYFEIYGGKLYDLLGDRRKLCMREDGRQQVCIVGLQEFEVSDIQVVKELIEMGNAARSTGSTGANEESSRSHAILQLLVKKHNETKESRRNIDRNASKSGKVVGKISFIDLAGNERGADTTDNDRQTRIEGAEINKSLLALKECIRALDNDRIHIPFRGSKLTEVLRDSFVGNSRTVMISCISPNAGSCEHTLNTLRYADRVKGLSKTGDLKKDHGSAVNPPVTRELCSAPSSSAAAGMKDVYSQHQEPNHFDTSKRVVEKEYPSYNVSRDFHTQPSSRALNLTYNRQQGSTESSGPEKDRFDSRNMFGDSRTYRMPSAQLSQNSDTKEVQKVYSPHRRDNEDDTVFGGGRTYNISSTQFSQNNDTEEVKKVSTPCSRAYEDERSDKVSQNNCKVSSTQTATEEEWKPSASFQRDNDSGFVFGGSTTYKISSTQLFQNTDMEEVHKVSPPRPTSYEESSSNKHNVSPPRRAYEDELTFSGSMTYKMSTQFSKNIDVEEVQKVHLPLLRPYEDKSYDKYSPNAYKLSSTQFSQNIDTEENLFNVSPPRRIAYEEKVTFGGSKIYKMPTTQLPQNNGTEEMRQTSTSQQRAYEDEIMFGGGSRTYQMPTTQLSQNTEKEEMQKVSPSHHRGNQDEIMYGGSRTYKMPTTQVPQKNDMEEIRQVLPSHGRAYDHERSDKLENWSSKDDDSSNLSTASSKPQNVRYSSVNHIGHRQLEPDLQVHEHRTNEILEEVEGLIAAHRKEVQDSMEIIRDERKLLTEVDQPGSLIDNYVSQLSFVMSRRAANLVSLQARLARFQHRLKEHENHNGRRTHY